MSRLRTKRIGITLGDPNGIGPEITAKALRKSSLRDMAGFVIIGDRYVYEKSGGKAYRGIEFADVTALPQEKWSLGKMTRESGAASLAYLYKSAALLKSEIISGIVTAPVSKEAICSIQDNFTGHTEFYAKAFGVEHVEMMFVAGGLRMVILTRHIPLKEVPKNITFETVLRTVKLMHVALQRFYRLKKPVIALCGLNPHAGEGGKMGKEEVEQMMPAIESARKEGIDVRGPLPADTVFTKGVENRFDLIIAMYHDQGLGPIKALYFNRLVNVTVGLPIIRTSPAHGTAYNIAGQNKADPSSMTEAIRVAVELVSKT
jgi:4-hydroxythreonine-4-phosphate dehydrogenase